MNKLTLEDWCKYNKAKLLYDDDVCCVVSISYLDDTMVLSSDTDEYEDVCLEDCQLILRPLSSLTEEEKERIKTIGKV